MKGILEGVTINWGFNPGDIFSNGMGIFATLTGFILLGIAIMYVPVLIDLIRNAVKPK
ncbi:hypothetical protein ABNF65_12890 [Paenibacillus larvae]